MQAVAGASDDRRLHLLESQLRKAQEQIAQLQRAARQHKGSGRARAPLESTAPANDGGAPAPVGGPRSSEPVLLLLDALHERGVISAADYTRLRQAILSTSKPEGPAGAGQGGAGGKRVAEGQAGATVVKEEKGSKRRFPVSVSYAFGKGLTFRSENRLFEASVRNRIQLRYEFVDQDDPALDDTSSFIVRRLKTRIRGYFLDPSVQYQFQVSYARRPTLDDALLRWRPRPYFALQAGQYQVPFNRQHLTSSGFQQFVERSTADRFFSFGRDLGFSMRGRWFGPKDDRLAWSLGIFNGNGGNQVSNDNTGHLGVARVLYMPFGGFKYYSESDVENTRSPRLGIGAAYAFNSQAVSGPKTKTGILGPTRLGQYFGTDFIDKFDISQATADFHFKYRGLSVLGDYFRAEASPSTPSVPSITAQGYDFQIGYFLLPRRLEAAFRYAFTDRDMDASMSGLQEIGGALGYFFLAHNLKLQMDVRDLGDEAPRGKGHHTMEYRTQLQAIF